MSLQSTSPPGPSSSPPGDYSQQSNSSLKPKSLQAARQKMNEYWTKKTIPVAIAVSVLPILGLGVLNFSVGRSIVNQPTSTSSSPSSERNAQQWLLLLLAGSSITAVLAGGLCWLWLKVFVKALVTQSTELVSQADQSQISGSLQELGRTIGLLQEQSTVQEVLDTSATEVRALLKTDRSLVFMTGTSGQFSMTAEDQGDSHSALLGSDLSQLSMPLEELFKVPMGYVQVCSQVEGSDLPKSHQTLLSDLNVQAQMVTQITANNESKGLLVVQQCSARDWTEVEHQLFAAIAKQIGIALERHTSQGQPIPVTNTASGTSSLWSNYQEYCFKLAQSSRNQADQLSHIMGQRQADADGTPVFGQGLQQARTHIQNHTEVLKTSETAVNQSITSITEMQETLAQSTHSSHQLIELGQKIAKTSANIKSLADQVNYQAMNASITAKKGVGSDQTWTLDFTNEILKVTRDLGRQTSTLESLSSQAIGESNTIATSVDKGAEQVLISVEWFRESRQQLNQMTVVNGQLDASLQRLLDANQARERKATDSHQQLQSLAHWLNQTVEDSSAMAQSIEQVTQRALA